MGNVEIDQIKLAGRTVFALRGFGEFEVRLGVDAYGEDWGECLRRLSSYGKEDILAAGGSVSNHQPNGVRHVHSGDRYP